MKQELLKVLNKNRAGSRPVAVATLLDTGEQWLIDNESDGGAAEKVTRLLQMLEPFKIVEVQRTGVIAIQRGDDQDSSDPPLFETT